MIHSGALLKGVTNVFGGFQASIVFLAENMDHHFTDDGSSDQQNGGRVRRKSDGRGWWTATAPDVFLPRRRTTMAFISPQRLSVLQVIISIAPLSRLVFLLSSVALKSLVSLIEVHFLLAVCEQVGNSSPESAMIQVAKNASKSHGALGCDDRESFSKVMLVCHVDTVRFHVQYIVPGSCCHRGSSWTFSFHQIQAHRLPCLE